VLSDVTAVNPSFTADVDGEYILSLIVSDGILVGMSDTVIISATTENVAPVANAGQNQNVSTGATVTLDGSASSDVNNDQLNYLWSFTSVAGGSEVTLTGETTVNPSFVAVDEGTYVLNLVVNDGQFDSDPDVVMIIAATENSAPVADAGSDQNVSTGSLVILDGSGSSDADNDDLTYLWNFNSIPDGSSASLSLATSVDPTFTADVDGTYLINLIVNDGSLDSTTSQVSVTAATINSAPVADAGRTQNVATGALVILDGSRSSDADNDPLTYSWTVITVAGVNGVTLTGGDTVNPSFIAVDTGSYVFDLIVNDGELDSSPDSVTIKSRP